MNSTAENLAEDPARDQTYSANTRANLIRPFSTRSLDQACLDQACFAPGAFSGFLASRTPG